MIPYGVYIGKDIEIVCTDMYTIVFRRHNEKDFLESLLLDDKLDCIGVCKSSPCGADIFAIADRWEYAQQGENPFFNDSKAKEFLGKQLITISIHTDILNIKFYDNTIYEATAHELFTMSELNPLCYTPEERSVAYCLKTWNLGHREIKWDGNYIGITIDTYKHMYIFVMMEGVIYCRAARYAVCDKGVVFNQNIRQYTDGSSFMLPDNCEAANELKYNEDFFESDIEIYEDRSIYWSVASVEQNRIVLHGCQGDKYEWNKPK
jgi:hypothetical protein